MRIFIKSKSLHTKTDIFYESSTSFFKLNKLFTKFKHFKLSSIYHI
jgi:hypothetical protein